MTEADTQFYDRMLAKRGRKPCDVPYCPERPPRRGTARRIWRRLEEAGFEVDALWYNPNTWGWGTRGVIGWGTWACRVGLRDGGPAQRMLHSLPRWEWFAGWHDGDAYIQSTGAPFAVVFCQRLIEDAARIS